MIQSPRVNLLDDEDADLEKEAAKIIQDSELWLNLPNSQLGGLRPRELIGTPQENVLRHLLRALRLGFST